MKKLLLILFVIFCISAPLQAQVNKEVEVTKAYIPTVSKGVKPHIKATIADTTYINADVDYSITPLSINTPLQSSYINPATVTYWAFNKPAVAQVKFGAGYPFNTLLKAYASGHNADIGYLAANIDHYGNYSKLESNSGEKVNATEILNSVALNAGLYVGRYALEGEVNYSNDSYHRYAFEQSNTTYINYQDIGASVRFGDSFVDLSSFNFNLGADYSRLFDRDSAENNTLYFESNFGRSIALGDLLFGVDFKHIDGGDSYSNQTTSLYASVFDSYEQWQLEMGLHYYYDQTTLGGVSETDHHIIPRFKIKRSQRGKLTPFVEIDGTVKQNNFAQIVLENPYIASGEADKSSAEYNLSAGVERGSTTGKFNYQLHFGYKIENKSRFYQLNVIESGGEVVDNYFELDLVKLTRMSLNAQINYKPTTNFGFSLDGHLYSYGTPQGVPYLYSPSTVELALGAEYSPKNFKVGVRAEYMGGRSYSVKYTTLSEEESISSESVVNISPTVNLIAYFDCRVNDRLSIFIDGDNLLGAELYPWPLYRGYGARFTAGVKVNFR